MYVRPCVAFRERRVFFSRNKIIPGKAQLFGFFILWHAPTLATWGRGTKFEQQPTKIMSRNRKITLVPRFFFRMWEKAFDSLLLFYRINSVAAASFSAFVSDICIAAASDTTQTVALSLSLDRVSQTGICNLHKIFLPEKKKREIFGSPNFVGSCYQYMPHAKSLCFPSKKSYTEEERRNHHYLPSVGVAANLRKVKACTGKEEEQ